MLALADDPDLALPPFGIGLNSGQVVAANVGSDLRRQYTVLGDAVNIGARLCSKAGPAEAVASAATVRRAGPTDLVLEPLPPMELKGVAEPVHAFVLRARDLDRVERTRPLGPPGPAAPTEPTPAHRRSGSASSTSSIATDPLTTHRSAP
jgi:class 3 adenylate cyclase